MLSYFASLITRRSIFTFLLIWMMLSFYVALYLHLYETPPTLLLTFLSHPSSNSPPHYTPPLINTVNLHQLPPRVELPLRIENTGDEKFFLYIPAFGPNNQYRGLKEAMVAARLLRRTLVLPSFIKHNTHGKEGYRPYNETFQSAPMEKFVPTISLSEFSKKGNGYIDILVWVRRINSYWRTELQNYLKLTNLSYRREIEPKYLDWNSNLSDDVNEKVYFSKLDSFSKYFKELGINENERSIGMAFPFRNVDGEHDSLISEASGVIERAESIQSLAQQAWLQMGTTKEKLLAVHWRHGEQTCRVEPLHLHKGYDFCFGTSAYFWGNLTEFISVLKSQLEKKGLTHIYLATDSEDMETYERMKKELPIRRASDIPVLSEIKDNYYLSLVEQEICTRAKFFVASAQTTWSEFIINYWDSKKKYDHISDGPDILTIDALLEAAGSKFLRHNYWGWILKTPVLPPPGCLFPQVDFPGGDIGSKSMDDPIECFNECQNKPGCQCWTHVASQRTCYFKGPVCPEAKPHDDSNVVSGPRLCSLSRTPDGCFWQDVDYKGNDIENTPGISNASDCFNLCKKNSLCQCWTQDLKTNTCWLKDKCSEPSSSGYLVSGKRTCVGSDSAPN